MPRYLCTDMEGAPSDDESGWSWMEIFAVQWTQIGADTRDLTVDDI